MKIKKVFTEEKAVRL